MRRRRLLPFDDDIVVSKRNGAQVFRDNTPKPWGGVYGLYNTVNGKWYIGESQNIKLRVNARYPKQVEKAFAEFRKSMFVFIPLCYMLDDDPVARKSVEADTIAMFNSVDNGYNIQAFSDETGSYGPAYAALWTKERRRQLGESAKRTEVWRALQTESANAKRLATFQTPQHLAKRSEAQIRSNAQNPELRKERATRISNVWKNPTLAAKMRVSLQLAGKTESSHNNRKKAWILRREKYGPTGRRS